jgi:hypothetical protein
MNDLLPWFDQNEEKSVRLAEELITRVGESLQELQHQLVASSNYQNSKTTTAVTISRKQFNISIN